MRAVNLFAGCGGMSKGFQDAGFDILAAYDSWFSTIKCYRANFSHPIFNFDLSMTNEAVRHIAQWNPEIIIGGPPCQDFSHAGKRKEGEQANLTLAFAKIIEEIRPSWFVMENVDRSKNSENYNKARKIFKNSGYGLNERLLDASFCGIPQKRKRFFCIGSLNEKDGFLDFYINLHLDLKPMTVREYLGNELGVEHYYRHPRNYNRRGIFSIDEPSPTVRGVNRPIPKGYPGHHGDSARISNNLRPLTTFERARLQTFPRDFKWVGSKTDLEQMIGNAVPVKLGEMIGKVILSFKGAVKNNKKVVA